MLAIADRRRDGHDPAMPTVNHKPLLRGHFHQAAFFIAFGACTMLVARSHEARSLTATLIYSFSLVGMFGISALYHRPQWGEAGRTWMKRLDHAAIFVLIAGTGTPICLLALPVRTGVVLFTTVWITALCGVAKSLLWVDSPKWVSAVLYVGVGWIYFYDVNDLEASLGTSNLILLLSGGVIYTLGAAVYATRRPNPSPRYFGYHEIFHAMVIVAATLHFLVINSLT